MRKALRTLLFSVLAASTLLLASCDTPAQKQQKAIATGVYKVSSSLHAGRIDLATSYSDELTRIVPKPKDFVPVQPLPIAGKNVLTVPNTFAGWEPLTLADPRLLAPEAAKQVAAEQKDVAQFSKKVSDTQRDIISKGTEPAPRTSAFDWAFRILGSVGILGIIALCIFAPQLIPLVVNVVVSLYQGCVSLVSGIVEAWKNRKAK